ncbi:MAG: hypothetical protein JSW38_00815 [Dehalococcoidia bacterium]|nr:MAG: hypothetical protein JSW38_00815 [Dehalococcoidia bacterium]
MPKREEEHTAGDRDREGRPLCPFCGSPEVSYLEKHGKWQCGKCERISPHVSRGSGGRRFSHYVPLARFKSAPGKVTYTQKGRQAKVTWQAVVVVIVVFAILVFLLSRC